MRELVRHKRSSRYTWKRFRDVFQLVAFLRSGSASMALLKLWNALRGRTTDEPAPPAGSSQSEQPGPAAAPVAKPAERKAKPGGLSLFGGGASHPALLKHLRSVTAQSVLEIAVGDGSRALEVLDLLAKNAASSNEGEPTSIRFVAMDQFEMGGGSHTLKEFHQLMRNSGVRPQVFPEPIDRGLMRVAHTIGSIDLIIISSDAGSWQTPETKSLLSRISHEDSLILFETENGWNVLALSDLGAEPVHRRAA